MSGAGTVTITLKGKQYEGEYAIEGKTVRVTFAGRTKVRQITGPDPELLGAMAANRIGLRHLTRKSQVLVAIQVNSLNNGTIQILVSKPQSNSNPVQTYPSSEEARQVLFALGIDETEIQDTLKLLSAVGPNQRLHFLVRDIPQKILLDHGFRL